MKRGFALLETIIVITFVTVSLMLLYGTFTSLIEKKEENILYDDVSNIYYMYYLKEYLSLYGLEEVNTKKHVELTCDDFSISTCSSFMEQMSLEHLYLVSYGLKDYDGMSTSLRRYLSSLSNKEDYDYWLVGEFYVEDAYHYASIGVMHDE